MKIAIISMIRDNWGGSEELWYDMAKTALREGHKVIHLSYDVKPVHPKMQELIAMGLVSVTRPTYRDPGGGLLTRYFQLGINFFKKRMNRSIGKIFQHEPDIVIYNGTCYSIAGEKTLIQYIKKEKPPFYIIGHFNTGNDNELSEPERRLVTAMYKLSKNVFFVSNRTKAVAEKQLGAAILNAIVLRNPVNFQDTNPVAFPENPTPQFALVGNLVTVHKGQDIAFAVLAESPWKERDYHLNIYGDGPDKASLQEMAASYDLSGKISFHGRVNDIRNVWKNNHLLLMPSRMEGMPLAIVEAMLCARAVVATDVGGISEWVEDGRTGFIAGEPTASSFAIALENAWQHKDRWKEMGSMAHLRAMELYDPSAGKTLLELLKK